MLYTVAVGLFVSKLWETTLNFDFGGYYSIILSSLIVTFLISLFLHGREFLLQWMKSTIDAERLKKESIMAQFESLKSQVNPHFLFNSLNALTNLINDHPDKAVRFVKQLSEVYRYVLDTRQREMVPIAEELKFLESYLFLQQIRFGNNLIIENTIRPGSSMVAPLALQILVKNAIKHNEVSSEHPLIIRVFENDQNLVVENSLRRKKVLTEPSSGIGLTNIKDRYEFLINREIFVVETEAVFTVKIPKISINFQ